jgi:pimeloyl-ACP methyl ester carboxylesterase
MQRAEDRINRVDNGRYLAQHIRGARYVELPGRDHLPFAGDADAVVDEAEEFVTGARRVWGAKTRVTSLTSVFAR